MPETYKVFGVSFSGLDNYDGPELPLEEARELARTLTTEGGFFTAWVTGEGLNECHQGDSVTDFSGKFVQCYS